MNIVFLCPHTKISGGVKVIFRLAFGLTESGHTVHVCVQRYNDQVMTWLEHPTPFNIVENPNPSYHNLPKADVVVNYGDGNPFIALGNGTKHVLFLQNFGIHDPGRERANILYSYDGVIVVSRWLAKIAQKCGQRNIHVVPPAIDAIFQKKEVPQPRIPVIGTLYHSIAEKNVALFEGTIQQLFTAKRAHVAPAFLSAKPIPEIKSFVELNIPYSAWINPPQSMLPYIYSSCALWMSPASVEGFGLTTLEAMACGCPVVTMQNFGLDDYLIDRRNCLLVTNKTEAANKIYELRTNPDLQHLIVANGLDLARRFTWDKTISMFNHALSEIVKK